MGTCWWDKGRDLPLMLHNHVAAVFTDSLPGGEKKARRTDGAGRYQIVLARRCVTLLITMLVKATGTTCKDLAFPQQGSWIMAMGSCTSRIHLLNPVDRWGRKRHLIVAISALARRNELCGRTRLAAGPVCPVLYTKHSPRGTGQDCVEIAGESTEKATQEEEWFCNQKQQLSCWSKFHRAIHVCHQQDSNLHEWKRVFVCC